MDNCDRVASPPHLQSGSGKSRGGSRDPRASIFTMENLDVDLGLSNLTLSIHSSEKVNEISVGYLLANIPMLAATITINLWAIRWQISLLYFSSYLCLILVMKHKHKNKIMKMNIS